MANQVAIITGGSRGIGAATACLAAAQGYAVILSYRTQAAAADAIVARITQAGGRARAVQADVSVEAEVVQLFDTAALTFGAVTALVNNAGIVETKSRVAEMTGERLLRVMATNVVGSFLCAREAIRRMSTARGGIGGAIVNVSSAAARLGSPGEFVDYAASKGAIDTFTLGLAREVGNEGIRVNAVRPGIILTEIHAAAGDAARIERITPLIPMQRAGDVNEVARAILWLLSDEASYITGTLLDVSGGR